MKILVTGITGRVGANLAVALVAEGHRVRGLVWGRDQRVQKLEGLGVELVEGTLTVVDDTRRALRDMQAVFHLGGAFQGGGPFTREEYFEINVRGTFNMLEAARDLEVGHFLFASTDAIFQKYVEGGMREPISEKTPSAPRGDYALTKALGEELCNGYWRSASVPTTILRFAMVMAREEVLDFPQFYLSRQKDARPELARLWEGEERLVILRDQEGRAFKKHVADVRDIVSGCLCALGKKETFGETFQLGGPAPIRWDIDIPRISEILRIPYIEAQLDGVPTHYELDLAKAAELINFRPAYDIVSMVVDGVRCKRGEDVGVLPT